MRDTQDFLLDAIDRQASLWLARQRFEPASAETKREFEAWRSADRRHAAAFARMSDALDAVGELQDLALLEPMEPASGARTSMRRWRTWAVTTLAVAASVALVVLVLVQTLARQDLREATHVAEVRYMALPDGSKITLGPKSRVSVHYTAGRRVVQLESGEAFFDVVHDSRRPFLVKAGDTVIRDVGTKFDVDRNSGGVRVGVLEGSVVVFTPTGRRAASQALSAGQAVEASGTSGSAAKVQTALLVQAPSVPAGTWRQGRLSYDDAPLGDIVSDLNRYYEPGVQLSDPQLAKQRVAASFKVSEIWTFLDNLPKALPVHVSQGSNGRIVIAPSKRNNRS